MAQLNMHVDAEFEQDLAQLVRLRNTPSKSAAIRLAVREAVEREQRAARATDFSALRGLALKAPLNPNPRYSSDDDLWKSDRGR